MKNITYTYSDVLIKPQYSEVVSRGSVDLTTKLGGSTLKLPIISSNMKNITGPKMAAEISNSGGLGLLHRFCTIEENLDMYTQAWQLAEGNVSCPSGLGANIGVSIGVKEEDKERFEKLYDLGARTFCIDVAHGHHILVKKMLEWISNEMFRWGRGERGRLTLIAGNVATRDAYFDLVEWGADVVKVGIGPGLGCITRKNTGVGVPQLHALEEVFEASLCVQQPAAIIADGGITYVGDIAKALKYADAVMLGSMIAGTSESPGNVFRNENNEFYKVYGGSAAGENKGENRFVEGVMTTVKFKGHVKYILREIEQGLQSAFSYVGANNLKEYQDRCEFICISSGSQRESKI